MICGIEIKAILVLFCVWTVGNSIRFSKKDVEDFKKLMLSLGVKEEDYKKFEDHQNELEDQKSCQYPKWPAPSSSSLAKYRNAAVVSDNVICSEIGRDILLKGGNAVDALIATMFCMGVVHPHSSGLGGGHSMLIYKKGEKSDDKCIALDSLEKAPVYTTADFSKDCKDEKNQDCKVKCAAAINWDEKTIQDLKKKCAKTCNLCKHHKGKRAKTGWNSIGVPGELSGLWYAHNEYGEQQEADHETDEEEQDSGETTEVPDLVETTKLPVRVETTKVPVRVETTKVPVRVETTEVPVRVAKRETTLGPKIPWKELIQPTIRLLEDGFAVSGSLARAIKQIKDDITKDNDMKNLLTYNDTGKYYEAGNLITTSARGQLFDTLTKLANASSPPDVFYKGDVAKKLVQDIRSQSKGAIIDKDLQTYMTGKKTPLKTTIKVKNTDWTICGLPPPSSGALVLSILKIMSEYNIDPDEDLDNRTYTFHRFIEAMKHVYSKQHKLCDDMGSTDTKDRCFKKSNKVKEMVDDEWVKKTMEKISRRALNKTKEYKDEDHQPKDERKSECAGSTHISVIDAYGNAAAATSGLNSCFGSKKVSKETGIILNNRLADFAEKEKKPNSIDGGKKPQSPMSPIIAYDPSKNEVKLVLGAGGHSHIFSAVAYAAMKALWFEDNIKEAIDSPRLHNFHPKEKTEFEKGFPRVFLDKLDRQHDQRLKEKESEDHNFAAANGIYKTAENWDANSDFRIQPTAASSCAGY